MLNFSLLYLHQMTLPTSKQMLKLPAQRMASFLATLFTTWPEAPATGTWWCWTTSTLTSWTTSFPPLVPKLSSDQCGQSLNGRIRWVNIQCNADQDIKNAFSHIFVGECEHDTDRLDVVLELSLGQHQHEVSNSWQGAPGKIDNNM